MKKLVFCFILLFSNSLLAVAQKKEKQEDGNKIEYKSAIGIRGLVSQGITFKQFIDEKAAIEVILGTRWRGEYIAALYEIHNPDFFQLEGFRWFYGAGAQVGYWKGYYRQPWYHDGAHTVAGICGILGVEYKIPPIPITASFDFRPVVAFYGDGKFWGDGCFTLRYIIK